MKFNSTKELKSSDKKSSESDSMLRAVEEENYKLKKDMQRMENRLKEYEDVINKKEKEIDDIRHSWNDAGDLAEFVLNINNVFQTAQKTADEYVDSNKAIIERKKQKANDILAEAYTEKERIIEMAHQEARRIQRLNLDTIESLQNETGRILDHLKETYDESIDNDDSEEEKRKIAI